MSFADIFHWAQNSGVLATAQKAAAAEAAKYIQQALTKATAHAPDMRPQLEQGAAQMLQAAVFGISTQAK